jgi:hypothetical protein
MRKSVLAVHGTSSWELCTVLVRSWRDMVYHVAAIFVVVVVVVEDGD